MPTPQRRRALLGGGRPSAFDAFDAADGALLTAYNAAWVKNTSASNNTAAPAIDSGRVHNENANTTSAYYRSDWVPSSPDYEVSADIVFKTDVDSSAGVVGRFDTAALTGYAAVYQTQLATPGWQLVRYLAGAGSLLGSAALTLSADQSVRVTLRMIGTAIVVLANGVAVISVTNAAVTAAGRAGFRTQTNATATTGLHLDNWQVVQ